MMGITVTGFAVGAVGAAVVALAFIPLPSHPFEEFGLKGTWSSLLAGGILIYIAILLGRWADKERIKARDSGS